jgi:hypothetical protein
MGLRGEEAAVVVAEAPDLGAALAEAVLGLVLDLSESSSDVVGVGRCRARAVGVGRLEDLVEPPLPVVDLGRGRHRLGDGAAVPGGTDLDLADDLAHAVVG